MAEEDVDSSPEDAVRSSDLLSYALPAYMEQPNWTGLINDRYSEVSFRLFQYVGRLDNYVLDMFKIETGEIVKYHLSVCKEDEWKVKAEHLSTEQLDPVLPVFEEISQFVQNKFNISLQERLVGWTIKEKLRKDSRIFDKVLK
ncbi:hypothetical protein Fot_35430 [Forsythia ovata]|uniref:Uncharacterized protein n=1 Tax=Forsythia ovata TaxID=205694 RepID=A0ABD1SLH9_9LAMI